MNKNIKYAIEISAFLGLEFTIDQFLGTIFIPTLNQLGVNFFLYNYYVNDFIDVYEKDKENFYNNIISSESRINEFATLISFFKTYKDLYFKDNKFYIRDYKTIKQNDEEIIDKDSLVINFIDNTNIKFFMDGLKILHWHDSSDKKNYKPANKIAEEMMKRAEQLKAEIKKKLNKKDEVDSSFLEIMSAVCARHPSINQTNIKDLNYYQIIDQFYRLQMIDKYGMMANAWSFGVLDKDGVKEMTEKHYTKKIKLDR